MRTTLDIADDVLLAAKEMARREQKSLGQVITTLCRRGFAQAALPAGGEAGGPPGAAEPLARYGIHPLPARGGIVTNDLIERLRDQEGL